jgi:hypothetical protein
MLSLKLATLEDVPEVIPVIKNLFDNSVYKTKVIWNSEDIISSLEGIINLPRTDGVVIVLYNNGKAEGVIVASVMNHFFNKNHRTAVELAFWINEDSRSRASVKQLLGAYKYWAKRAGCHSILMGKLNNKNEVETYTIRKLR